MDNLYIGQRDGTLLDLNNLHPTQINLKDAAETLSRKGRYNDVSDRRETVLDHSLIVYRLAALNNEPNTVLLASLIHDFSEAYVGDLIAPIKHSPYGHGFNILEDKVQKTVFQAVFANRDIDYKSLLQFVKPYDKAAQKLEVPIIFDQFNATWWSNKIDIGTLKLLTRQQVESVFDKKRNAKIIDILYLISYYQRELRIKADDIQYL